MKRLLIIWLVLLSCNRHDDVQPAQSIAVVTTTDNIVVITADTSLPAIQPVFLDQTVIKDTAVAATIPYDRLVYTIYTSQVGVRERTGHNDGVAVEKYLRATGLGKGFAWCAAFVRWSFDSAKIATPITAWAPSAENKANYVYRNGKLLKELQQSDVFTLYYPNLKRIGHTGFINRRFGVNSVETTEGNTNSAGSREGDGVYIKIRPKQSLHSITRWF